MVAEAGDLIDERGGGDFLGLGSPTFPVLPHVAADPAGHDEDAELIGLFEEFVAVGLPFQADGVEAHAADVGEVGVELPGVPTEEHIGSPRRTADEDALAVDLEEAAAGLGEFGGDLADAEMDGGGVGDSLARLHTELRGVEIRIAHLVGPPKMRHVELERGEFLGIEADDLGFVGGELDGLLDVNRADIGRKSDFGGMIGGIAEFGAEHEVRCGVVRMEFRGDERLAQRHAARGSEEDFAPHAGVFVGRCGIPVYPGEAEIIFFGSKDFDGEGVLAGLVQEIADLKFVGTIGAGDVVASGELLAVEPDVGTVIDAQEMEPDETIGRIGGRGEFGAKPEGTAEGAVRRACRDWQPGACCHSKRLERI